MTRKLLTLGVLLAMTSGVLAVSAWAGPGGARDELAGGSGGLRAMSRSEVPFATGLGVTDAREKPLVKLSALGSAPTVSVAEPLWAPMGWAAEPLSDPRQAKVAPGLAARLAASAPTEERFDVVVTTAVDPRELSTEMKALEVRYTYRKTLFGFAARMTKEQILAWKAMPTVESIGTDEVVRATVDNAGRWTGATKAREDYGLTGDGDGWEQRYSARDVVIAVVDTGIDPLHKDLRGKVIGWKDIIAGKASAYDDNGHGTHVAGTAAGAGMVNPSIRGVAPGAALVGVKVLTGDGSGTFGGVIAGIEWVVEHKDTYNIRVLNLSLGSASSSDGIDPLSRAVNGAVESGILAVVAVGNNGPDDYTVGSPGAAARALTICAMRDAGEGGWSLAPFSARGPTADGRTKPDLCAPGVRISGVKAGTEDRFVSYSGSSIAAPFVAGVAALLLEANPYLSPSELRELLISTAQDWGVPGQDNDFGHGRINVYRAIQRAMGMSGLGPSGPTHAVGRGKLPDGAEVWYRFEVTDTRHPIAATLLMTDTITEYYDCDLFLYDAEGNELAAADDIYRQETVHVQPVKKGTYYLRVQNYEGSGPYTLDVSWR